MALDRGYNVRYRWQGISLHCWMTALEMLMDWRYGSIYGVDPATGARRNAHTPQVVAARSGMGYPIGNVVGYGLRRVDDDLSANANDWAAALRAGGPMLATGDYGPARIVGKHVVLVVGISGSNKIVYLDPFLIGMKAIVGNHYTYVSGNDAYNRLDKGYGQQGFRVDLFRAAAGSTDAGFGW
jgi:hypothetical protein